MPKPTSSSHSFYVQRYIDLVPEEDLHLAFTNQASIMFNFLSGISEEQSAHAYAEGKWTLKELLQHIIDTEWIFSYRAVCFARKEQVDLPGFEENNYAANSNANSQTWQSLIDQLITLRKATETLFKSFNEQVLQNSGIANNNPATVASIGFTTVGHFYHHKKIIEERYL